MAHASVAAVNRGQAPTSSAASRPVVDRYCVGCHSERGKAGGLSLEGVSPPTWAPTTASAAEASCGSFGSVPCRRRDRGGLTGRRCRRLWRRFKTALDRAAASSPESRTDRDVPSLEPGRVRECHPRPARPEVDAAAMIPADETSFGFDNIGGVLKISPVFAERYAATAQKISRGRRLAEYSGVGNRDRLASDLNQDHTSRGCRSAHAAARCGHNFPLDAEYQITAELLGTERPSDLQRTASRTLSTERAHVQLWRQAAAGRARPWRAGRARRALVDGECRSRRSAEGRGRAGVEVIDDNRGSGNRKPSRCASGQGRPPPLGRRVHQEVGGVTTTPRQTFIRPASATRRTSLNSGPSRSPVRSIPTGPGDTPSRAPHLQLPPDDSCGRRQVRPARLFRRWRVTPIAVRRTARRPSAAARVLRRRARRSGGSFEAGIELALRRLLVSP